MERRQRALWSTAHRDSPLSPTSTERRNWTVTDDGRRVSTIGKEERRTIRQRLTGGGAAAGSGGVSATKLFGKPGPQMVHPTRLPPKHNEKHGHRDHSSQLDPVDPENLLERERRKIREPSCAPGRHAAAAPAPAPLQGVDTTEAAMNEGPSQSAEVIRLKVQADLAHADKAWYKAENARLKAENARLQQVAVGVPAPAPASSSYAAAPTPAPALTTAAVTAPGQPVYPPAAAEAPSDAAGDAPYEMIASEVDGDEVASVLSGFENAQQQEARHQAHEGKDEPTLTRRLLGLVERSFGVRIELRSALEEPMRPPRVQG